LPGFLVRTLVSALGLWIASALISGLTFRDNATLLLAALLLGMVNAVVRPVFVLLTLPITVLTLGGFLLVVNAAMLGLVAALLDGFRIDGYWAALGGGILVSLTSWVASWYVGPRGRVEVMVVRSRT